MTIFVNIHKGKYQAYSIKYRLKTKKSSRGWTYLQLFTYS